LYIVKRTRGGVHYDGKPRRDPAAVNLSSPLNQRVCDVDAILLLVACDQIERYLKPLVRDELAYKADRHNASGLFAVV
jgi:hypothetical protein